MIHLDQYRGLSGSVELLHPPTDVSHRNQNISLTVISNGRRDRSKEGFHVVFSHWPHTLPLGPCGVKNCLRADVVVLYKNDRFPSQLRRILDSVQLRRGAAIEDNVEPVILSKTLRGAVLVR